MQHWTTSTDVDHVLSVSHRARIQINAAINKPAPPATAVLVPAGLGDRKAQRDSTMQSQTMWVWTEQTLIGSGHYSRKGAHIVNGVLYTVVSCHGQLRQGPTPIESHAQGWETR